MHIIKLEVENVKRLRAVEVEPTGALIQVSGRNEQGKTSLIDSIAYAMGGERLVPEEPIRRGARSARVAIDLGELKVERRWSRKGSVLKVTDRDGNAQKSPQKLLDQLVGALTFDPLEFSGMDRPKQADVLKALLGISFEDLDERRREMYEGRTTVNRDLKAAEVTLAGLDAYPDAPDDEVVVSELIAERDRRAAHNDTMDLLTDKIETAKEGLKVYQEDLQQLQTTISGIEARLESDQAELKGMEARDVEETTKQIEGAETTNAQVRGKRSYLKVKVAVKGLRETSETESDKIEKIDQEKRDLMAAAEFPVEGLGFDDDGMVTLEGLPFNQASHAQTLRVSVAMGIAMNPALRVMLIREGDHLDAENLRTVSDMAEDSGTQVWMERVNPGEGCAVIIEDGRVVDQRGEGEKKTPQGGPAQAVGGGSDEVPELHEI